MKSRVWLSKDTYGYYELSYKKPVLKETPEAKWLEVSQPLISSVSKEDAKRWLGVNKEMEANTMVLVDLEVKCKPVQ